MFWSWDILGLGHLEAWDVLQLGHFIGGTLRSWEFCIQDVSRLGRYVLGHFVGAPNVQVFFGSFFSFVTSDLFLCFLCFTFQANFVDSKFMLICVETFLAGIYYLLLFTKFFMQYHFVKCDGPGSSYLNCCLLLVLSFGTNFPTPPSFGKTPLPPLGRRTCCLSSQEELRAVRSTYVACLGRKCDIPAGQID